MSCAAFLLTVDRQRALISIEYTPAFWGRKEISDFIAGYQAALGQTGVPVGRQRTIVDLRNAILQSQDVIAAMQRVLADERSGRVALVADSPMARMQTKRLQVRLEVKMFADKSSAEDWLFGSTQVAAA